MKKISDDPVRFVVSLEEVRKYGLCPLGQLKRNPEVKLLFLKKSGRGEEIMSAKEIAKRNDVLRRSIPPPGVKVFLSLRPNSAYSYLVIRSMPFAENISILQERSGGAVGVFLDIKKFPAFKISAF